MDATRPKTSWSAIHGGLFVAALVLIPVSFPQLGWPWYLLVPLSVYCGVAFLIPSLRRTVPRLAFGQINRFSLAFSAFLSAATIGVLTAYQWLFQPDVTNLARTFPVAAFGSLVLAGVVFSVVNAVLEELVFRWVLFEAFAAEWGALVAVTATAIFFGLGHMRGYPPGPVGAVLAGLYGLALGLLRWWTGGLALPIACHICADATIFGILVAQGAFPP